MEYTTLEWNMYIAGWVTSNGRKILHCNIGNYKFIYPLLVGKIEYCVDGVAHRENGPAITLNGGENWEWCYNGNFHREYGPAIHRNGAYGWFIHGLNITPNVERWIKEQNIPHWDKWTNKERSYFKLKWI